MVFCVEAKIFEWPVQTFPSFDLLILVYFGT